MATDRDESYLLNIEECIKDTSIPSVIRMMFQTLREQSYIIPAQFFQEISDSDLEMLVDLAEDCHPDTTVSEEQQMKSTEPLILLALGLAVGEGFTIEEDMVMQATQTVVSFAVIESLHRKGLVKALYENWSVVEDNGKPIVERIV